jgi:hypothetical protein
MMFLKVRHSANDKDFVFSSPLFSSSRGGGEACGGGVAGELRKRRYKVSVVTEQFAEGLRLSEVIDGVRVFSYPLLFP